MGRSECPIRYDNMFLFEFVQTRNGIIASVIVGAISLLTLKFVSDPSRIDQTIDNPSAIISGPLELVIVSTEDVGDGVYVLVEITNISEKSISSAKGRLIVKDEFHNRLMSDEQRLITSQDEPLLPGESIPMGYYLMDQYFDEIKYFTFHASFITFEESYTSK